MENFNDVEVGEDEVAVVLHRPNTKSDRFVRGVCENEEALREFVQETFTRLERSHISVRLHRLRE